MKKIWKTLHDHWKNDFSWPYYLSIGAFLAVGIILNLFFQFEPMIDRHNGTLLRAVGYLLLYSISYYGSLAIVCAFNKQARQMVNRNFWLLSLLGLVVLTLYAGFPYISSTVEWLDLHGEAYVYAYLVAHNAIGFLFVPLPLFLIYPFITRLHEEGYGLITPRYDVKPYFLLLMLMIPLIVAASFTEGFINYYPTYKSNALAATLELPRWMPPMIYEFFYGMDFFNVELLFRGFLVVGLSRWLGKDAIMPMVTTYCFIHFGKPLGETISSIAGGYILGVLAMYTRGIWGGVIIHMGIAWCMEIVAYLQKLIQINSIQP